MNTERLTQRSIAAIQGAQGLAHVVVNLKPTRRPPEEALRDLARHVLPILEQD